MKIADHKKYEYGNDDYSRFSGPEYLDRVSLGKAHSMHTRSDAMIYEDICEAVLNDSKIEASDIDIEVHKGRVFLNGSVDSPEMKDEVEECIFSITGVVEVINNLNSPEFRDAGVEGLIKNQARIDP